MAEVSNIGPEGEEGDFLMICAFCFRTSAGVRIRQETASAREEAVACRRGVGIRGDWNSLGESVWLREWRRDLVAS